MTRHPQLDTQRPREADRSQANCNDYINYREAAITLWGQAGAYCHDRYNEYRRSHYLELPEQLPIVIGITAYGRCLGLTRGGWEHGPRISIASRLFRAVGIRAVDDTMIHEMLHAWLLITGQDPDHGSEAWYAAVRRLSPVVLGHELDARRGARRRSVRVPNPEWTPESNVPKTLVRKVKNPEAVPHGSVARWPERPPGYDYGARMPCPSY
jgi:SprT-like family